ncbi:hypothetical protein JNK13_11975 [bacterium]|nr:hypothetical protein [bacterium]
MVFLFPLLLEGGEIEIWKRSLKLSNQAGGTVKVMLTVIPIAATMIFGGFFRAPLRRGNFVRAWCIGCLAIIVWYERLRVEEELCKQN